MRCREAVGWMTFLAIMAAGCGGSGKSSTEAANSDSPPKAAAASNETPAKGDSASAKSTLDEPWAPKPPADLNTPEGTVFTFLQAIRAGDDTQTTAMLTPLARQKLAETKIPLTPHATDTAQFELGDVQRLADDGARVLFEWTDNGKDGTPQTDEAMCMVRKEAEGWRVAGMAVKVIEGKPLLLLDFEDPKETVRKLQVLQEQIAAMAEPDNQATEKVGKAEKTENPEPAALQARQPEKTSEAVLR